ncbi:hypothetical protein K435DRAFT_32280 [Dendrothele bispora CBS 962.96]|uniref:Uncharacterized protein n=1 Tax=Dendrothele bispora (strain CBS 962.96) TaxID=1314807 RepID=A0A4S8KTX1_DENBC|nr:hypothetical protein K435DRAFT_32280 [Dendrothele bispora CBS 962.96]
MHYALDPRSLRPLLRDIHLTDTPGGSQVQEREAKRERGEVQGETQGAYKPQCPVRIQTGLDRYQSQFSRSTQVPFHQYATPRRKTVQHRDSLEMSVTIDVFSV